MAIVNERHNATKPVQVDPKTGRPLPPSAVPPRAASPSLDLPPDNSGFFGSFFAPKNKKKMAAMDSPPPQLKASGTLSEKEANEVEVISKLLHCIVLIGGQQPLELLINSYFHITRRTMIDMVPKAIMLNLVQYVFVLSGFLHYPSVCHAECTWKAHQRWNAARAPGKYVPGQRNWRITQGKRLHYTKEEGMPADGWIVIESERDCQPGSVRDMSLLKRMTNWAKRYPEKKEHFLTRVHLSAPPSASPGFWYFSTGDWVTWMPTYSRRLPLFSFLLPLPIILSTNLRI